MKGNDFHKREDCRLCHSRKLEKVIELAPTPPANAFVPKSELGKVQAMFPLDVYFCNDCFHVQLLDVVNPEILFKDYLYVSGTSPVFVKHFENLASDIVQEYQIPRGALAVDVGSNDGTLLSFFKARGLQVLGIDPAGKIALDASEKGISTIPAFFGSDLAKKILSENGPAKVVTANNVFAHIDDLDDVARGVETLLDKDGIFVFEVSYLKHVYERTLFDTIYHEHLCYHSVKPLQAFFERHGLMLVDVQSVETHGGSLRAVVQRTGGVHQQKGSVAEFVSAEAALGLHQPGTFANFSKDIDELRTAVRDLIGRAKSEGKTVAAFGAPAKATTLCFHFDLNRDCIDFIVDDSPLKQNLFSPGLHIPVLPAAAMYERRPDFMLILAWNFADSIISKHKQYLETGGRFVVPVPKVRVVTA